MLKQLGKEQDCQLELERAFALPLDLLEKNSELGTKSFIARGA